MSDPRHITSRENPGFKALRALLANPRREGRALLDGVHLVATCLARGIDVKQLMVSESGRQNAEIAALVHAASDVDCVILRDSLFREISGVSTPTGIAAVIGIPPVPSGVLAGDAVLLDAVQDAGNVGAILRTAAAAGVHDVILGTGCAGAWTPRVLRAGQGAHFSLAIREQADLAAGWRPARPLRSPPSPAAVAVFTISISAGRSSGWWATKVRDCRRNSSRRRTCVPRFHSPRVPNRSMLRQRWRCACSRPAASAAADRSGAAVPGAGGDKTNRPAQGGPEKNRSADAYFFLAAFLPATAALKVAPAVKRGTVVAAILSSLPVCGLRPIRAARFDDLKLPKPTRVTGSPLETDLTMAAMTADSAFSAAALLISASLAVISISSDLFMCDLVGVMMVAAN
jgi:hypothetical protein